jgi:hypothetical protein
MCDIFIMCFVLFLFVTCFGWNFNVIAAAGAAAAAVEEEEGGGGGGGGGGDGVKKRRRRRRSLWIVIRYRQYGRKGS